MKVYCIIEKGIESWCYDLNGWILLVIIMFFIFLFIMWGSQKAY